MKKILIVEDDKQIAELERDYLEINHYEVDLSYNGAEGLEMALSNEYSLIILDIMLPFVDGLEICRQINEEKDVPIILVTAKSDNMDKIKGLSLGATDYIIKPFEPSELVARVEAHIKRYERLVSGNSEKSSHIAVGKLLVDKKSRRVFLGDKEIVLPNKEFDLLFFLISHPNTVFSKNSLLDNIWGNDFNSDTSTITVHINRIRDKIESDTTRPEYIETVWGAGYRFKM